VSKI
jgi:hypothetical protein